MSLEILWRNPTSMPFSCSNISWCACGVCVCVCVCVWGGGGGGGGGGGVIGLLVRGRDVMRHLTCCIFWLPSLSRAMPSLSVECTIGDISPDGREGERSSHTSSTAQPNFRLTLGGSDDQKHHRGSPPLCKLGLFHRQLCLPLRVQLEPWGGYTMSCA